jgi:glutamyl-tRNA synthetase
MVMAWIQQNQLHTGNIMNAFRLAIVGEGKGPHMFHITDVIGREETLRRLEQAVITLSEREDNH